MLFRMQSVVWDIQLSITELYSLGLPRPEPIISQTIRTHTLGKLSFVKTLWQMDQTKKRKKVVI